MLLDRAYETAALLGFDEADTRVIIYNYKVIMARIIGTEFIFKYFRPLMFIK